MTTANATIDDPRDYRRRYHLPDQFVWEVASWPRIDFDGYASLAMRALPSEASRILDVGCGPGFFSSRLVEAGHDVVGVDFNERAIAFARILVPDATFVLADIREIGALDLGSSFDAATCIEVLEHIPPHDRATTMESVFSALSPGAPFVITTPTRQMWSNRWDYERATLEELRDTLRRVGFTDIDVGYQHRLTRVFSPSTWRLLTNRWYDIPAARRAIRRRFLSRWNETTDPDRAGRFVIRAVRP